jgi:hypothetical protein
MTHNQQTVTIDDKEIPVADKQLTQLLLTMEEKQLAVDNLDHTKGWRVRSEYREDSESHLYIIDCLVESEDSEDAHYHFPFAVTGEQTENT